MSPGTSQNQNDREQGIALLSALLVMLLMAGVTAGFTALVITDTRVRMLDSTRTQSFYAVHAGLEQLTADLGDLFAANVAPTAAQINAITATPPAVGVTWQNADGTNGYQITYPTDAGGNPQASIMTVQNGPFQGLVGLATPYQMSATGRLRDGSESSLTRTLQTVAIPVFQFGIFSENDLNFFAGPNFNFGGRVHSNANLYLAQGNGTTLTLADRVTTVGEIIRTNLSNGWDTNTNYTGTVRAITAPAAFRNLLRTEGSLVGTVGSAVNEPTWTNLSTGTYNSNIMNGRTGARRLDLPIAMFGQGPVDLIKRPAVGEDVTNLNLLNERFFSLASLRILLSDTAADITNLPTVTPAAPIPLGIVEPAGYTVGGAANLPPFAQTPGAAVAGQVVPNNTPLLGGFLKIEMQTVPGTWVDVTMELLNLGIGSPAYRTSNTGSAMCADINANAVIRLQRSLDNAGNCFTIANLTTDGGAVGRWVPQVLFDAREGTFRDASPGNMRLSGLFHYVELDVRNLSRWFNGVIGTTGNQALNVNGFTVYFSDRRGNRNAANQETGELGFEDFVNPASATGAPNGILDVGEDMNNNGLLDTYGNTPRLPSGLANWTAGWNDTVTLTAASTLTTQIAGENVARRNPLIFFRRALKLTNGALGNIVAPGLTVASENPVYVQGHWNANAAGFGNPHVATAVLADSVTLLSNNWNDRNSLINPYVKDTATFRRNATTTWYRLAIISGKGLSFPQPAGTPQDFGTDGGAHNFLRYIEDWGGQTLNYRGSIASLYISRQAVVPYKCCNTVYDPPTRGYNFDTEFLTPSLLPPRTPMFRDVNITGFAQIIRP
jgi:hypothetical protein